MMKVSDSYIEKLKEFEGFSAKACKCVSTEKYYTIGYGHYGADVKETDTITKKKATELLKEDVAKHEKYVTALKMSLKQNSFDALVDFSYNCGSGNLSKLCSGRTLEQIAEHITAYNKSGGKVLAGLTKRRNYEKELIEKDLVNQTEYLKKYTGKSTSIVLALKELGYNSTYTYRKKLATKNGIKNYSGLGSQNELLLQLLKKGKLIKA